MSVFYTLPTDKQTLELKTLAYKALENWSVENPELWLLKYRENCVFGVKDSGTGTKYVLRIHRPGYHSGEALHSELKWMEALHNEGIHTPQIIRTIDEKLLVSVQVDEVPEARICDLLSWVEGEILGNIEGNEVPSTEEVKTNYQLAGQLAARIHCQAENWILPEDFQRPVMDGPGLVSENGYLGDFRIHPHLNKDQLSLLCKAADAVSHDLERFGKTPDRFGLTHADFLPENLLIAGDVIHIIDFDDCGFGWHIMDIATSLFFLQGEDIFNTAREGLIEGYRSVRSLPEEHIAMLPACFLARGLAYVGWTATRQETAEFTELSPMLIEGALTMAEKYL